MTKCRAMKKDNTPCTRSSHKGGYCKQHGQTEKIAMFKKELSKLHRRVRDYVQRTNVLYEQIDLIQRLDWIKFRLREIGGYGRAFREIASDIVHQDALEELFGLPFYKIEKTYLDMLERRNGICHKYTKFNWNKRPLEIHL